MHFVSDGSIKVVGFVFVRTCTVLQYTHLTGTFWGALEVCTGKLGFKFCGLMIGYMDIFGTLELFLGEISNWF